MTFWSVPFSSAPNVRGDCRYDYGYRVKMGSTTQSTVAGSRAVNVDQPTSAVQGRWERTERVLKPIAFLEGRELLFRSQKHRTGRPVASRSQLTAETLGNALAHFFFKNSPGEYFSINEFWQIAYFRMVTTSLFFCPYFAISALKAIYMKNVLSFKVTDAPAQL